MIPYPAAVSRQDGGYLVKVLDFEDVQAFGGCTLTALKAAQGALLHRLMVSMRDHVEIPPPDQYLDVVDPLNVVMLDPLQPVESILYAA